MCFPFVSQCIEPIQSHTAPFSSRMSKKTRRVRDFNELKMKNKSSSGHKGSRLLFSYPQLQSECILHIKSTSYYFICALLCCLPLGLWINPAIITFGFSVVVVKFQKNTHSQSITPEIFFLISTVDLQSEVVAPLQRSRLISKNVLLLHFCYQ